MEPKPSGPPADGRFAREDESDDLLFYATDRFVNHLDSLALATVERVVGSLVVEGRPAILDLMAGWYSHIPGRIHPKKVVGLGLNERELKANPALTDHVIHDVNRDPRLPFDDETFDIVLNTVSVDYMTRPVEVFREVFRVLRPGGLFAVIFSNRYFPPKVVKVWRESDEEERVLLVEGFFREAGGFRRPRLFSSKGRPRPPDDKYAGLGIPSDPVYAVFAEKRGGPARRRQVRLPSYRELPDDEELGLRMKEIGRTRACPYCGKRMSKWRVPQTPFTEWPNEFMYVCFDDACPYYVRGWDVMDRQGNFGLSYRLMYNPERDRCMPVPVPSALALRDGIVSD